MLKNATNATTPLKPLYLLGWGLWRIFFAKIKNATGCPQTLDFTGFLCGTFLKQKRHNSPQSCNLYVTWRIFRGFWLIYFDLLDIHAMSKNSPFETIFMTPKWVIFKNSPFMVNFPVSALFTIKDNKFPILLVTLYNQEKIDTNFVAFFKIKNATFCHR